MQRVAAIIGSWALLLSYVQCAVAIDADPCSSYKTLDNAWRDANQAADPSGVKCDNLLTTGWYRLQLNGADAIMPTDATGVFRCGTAASLWFQGAMPDVGQTTQGTACASWAGNTCNPPWSSTTNGIQVKNCGAFYVYNLQPSKCNCAYCAVKLQKPSDPCNTATVLSDSYRYAYAKTTGTLRCDNTLNGGWYRLKLNGNDAQLPTTAPDVNNCGTAAPVWYQGTMPEAGQTATGTGCANWAGNTCNPPWTVNGIQVKNCGAYYVYYLLPTTCNVAYCTQADPCVMNTVMDNTWRDVSAPAVFGAAKCDNLLSKDWYRLKLNGADAIIPTDAAGVYRCGTSAAVWYNGVLPASGQTATGQGCASWAGNTCNPPWTVPQVTVKNCGAFYVYLLSPTGCTVAYCAQTIPAPADPCTSNTVLSDSWRYVYAKNTGAAQCDRSINGGWYRLKLNGNDAQLPTTAPVVSSCGTSAPLWFQGTLPSPGQISTGTGCANWAGNTCNPPYTVNGIKVKNCNGYFVYYLLPTNCDTAYCTISDPCTSSVILNNAWRDAKAPPITGAAVCDNTMAKGWYRFQLNGVDAVMPTDAPGVNRCGTSAPLWFNGPMPTSQNTTTGVGCANWAGNTCNPPWTVSSVQVKNCDSYYVYFLSPTACNTAYCSMLPAAPSDPCDSAKVIDDAWRNFNEPTKNTMYCDQSLNAGWYRLKLSGVDAQLPTTPPPINTCGTAAPLWYQGTMPNVGETQTGTACANWAGNTCNPPWTVSNIKVKGCNGYYVYYLIPSVCNTAYCAMADPCIDNTVLDHAWRNVNAPADARIAKCDNTLAFGWYRLQQSGVDAIMPMDAAGVYRCGTAAPIWYNGTLPNVGQISSAQGCANWAGNTCNPPWTVSSVSVKNCGSFYTYLLSPTGCTVAYCTQKMPTPSDPCTSATILSDSYRFTYAQGAGTSKCDNTLNAGWYRLQYQGNDAQLPTTAPNVYSCGTAAPVWYQGTMPAPGQTATGTGCANWAGNTCNPTYSVSGIQVKNCGAYNIYYLKPSLCDVSYCASPDPCVVNTVLDNPWRAVDVTGTGTTKCDNTLAVGWYRMKINGAEATITTTAPAINTCGTSAPIWFRGTMPANGSTTTGTGCANWAGNTCNPPWTVSSVSVKNCGSFYVYLLSPTVCHTAYALTADPCASSPCNSGTCNKITSASFTCTCNKRSTGTFCETAISPCDSNPCANGGKCLPSDDGSTYSCTCASGFTGASCQSIVNPCDNSQCSNGGKCAATSSTAYTCACTAGFTGKLCDIAINPCDSAPCLNGGSCTKQTYSTFTCKCTADYTGPRCTTEVNPCDSYPCAGSATCNKLSPTTFTCSCAFGYTGATCSSQINPCESGPCVNGGTCTQAGTSFSCSCKAGFTGGTCSSVVNPCDSSPCNNDATCKATSGTTFTCTCTADYTGTLCQTFIDPCATLPCLHGGTCTRNSATDFDCNCVDDWNDGDTCSTYQDPCLSKPCQHNGICIRQSASTFTCSCGATYTGAYCELKIGTDPCSNVPCLNGGTCANNDHGGYDCTCTSFYEGAICDKIICLQDPVSTTCGTVPIFGKYAYCSDCTKWVACRANRRRVRSCQNRMPNIYFNRQYKNCTSFQSSCVGLPGN